MGRLAPYAKAVIAVVFAVITAVQTLYPGQKWTMIVTAAIGALGVYLVPNAATPPASAAQPPPPHATSPSTGSPGQAPRATAS